MSDFENQLEDNKLENDKKYQAIIDSVWKDVGREKKVRFSNTVNVVLIPTKEDCYGIDLHFKNYEYDIFMNEWRCDCIAFKNKHQIFNMQTFFKSRDEMVSKIYE